MAEFERALIRERTRPGLAAAKSRGRVGGNPRPATPRSDSPAAKSRGRVGGNPGLKSRDPVVLRKLARSRRAGRAIDLLPGLDEWLPVVRRLRPHAPWPEVAEAVDAALPRGRRPFTHERLVRAVRLLAAEGLAGEGLLAPAPRRRTGRGASAPSRAVEVAAALVAGRPGITPAELGAELARLRHVPPRGGAVWAPSSLKALLDRARMQGLLAPSGSA